MLEIFYVDDSRDDVFYLEYMIRRETPPFVVRCFQTSVEAYDELLSRSLSGLALPAVLVADFYMPPSNGAEFVAQLKGDARFADVRVGICSGSDDEEDRKLAASAGAQFYLIKPLDLQALAAIGVVRDNEAASDGRE